MTHRQPRHYDSVDFPAYLDSGISDPPISPELLSLPAGSRSADFAAMIDTTTPAPGADTSRRWLLSALSRICEELLGVAAVAAEFPGGDHRASCRLILADGRTVIASRRESAGRARLEKAVQSHLYSHRIDVPAVFGFNGLVLLQEDLSGERLGEMLTNADEQGFERHLSAALDSLATIHQVAEQTGLDQAVPVIGADPDWLLALLDRTAVIGGYLGIACPFIPVDDLFDLLEVRKPRFVKWDARPGNAMVSPEGGLRWFDWEHCGARNRLDDMAWLLCDESVPTDFPEAEDRLVAHFLPLFADGRSVEEAELYLRVWGVLHSCVRLGRLLNAHAMQGWPQADALLEKSTPGASRKEALRLATRARRWSAQAEPLRMLEPWFDAVHARLEEM